MDNIRSLLGIRRMDKILNALVRKLWEVTKGVDERIEGVLQWFSHVKRMENGRIAKRVYLGELAGSCSVGRPWKRWIDTLKEFIYFFNVLHASLPPSKEKGV